ncbi:MAG: dihydrolipoamide acetyltransferase family protein, partial [Bryobacteraceae bacterium]
LEMAQETGKLISWLKKEGEAVSKGEPLLEIETDKAVMEIEAPGDGVLAGVKVEAGAEVPVGKTIAWIVRPGEAPPAEETATASGRKNVSAAGPASAGGASSSATSSSAASSPSGLSSIASSSAATTQAQSIKISPKARRLASERGADLAKVHGSGPNGEILASDILAAAEAAAIKGPATVASSAVVGSPIARLMAERTTQSWTTTPHFFVVREMDATALNEARQRLGGEIEQSRGMKLTHTDLLVALAARVLRKHARINASWTGGGVRENNDINVGIAMAVQDGVVAPVVRHADRTALGEIATRRRELSERARSGKLRPEDLAGGTFTISNLGMYEVDAFTAIIIPPQAAILAVGRIADRVVPVGAGAEARPGIRPYMTLTLSSDHRVVDGARAAEFLRDLAEAIANPLSMLG